MSSCYNVVIVGAGAAGLRVGVEVLKRRPSLRCCILEKYNYIGGRVVTYHKEVKGVGEVQWENGAGRISTSHKRVLRLMRRYGLTFVPLQGETKFLSMGSHVFPPPLVSNRFYQMLPIYLAPLSRLTHEVLATHTLGELLEQTLGAKKAKAFYQEFPYYAEIHLMRADLALHSFEEEMGTNEGFGVCAEGYQAITEKMREEFVSLGGEVIMGMTVTGVASLGDGGQEGVEVHGVERTCLGSKVKRVFMGKKVVLALHSVALRNIQGVRDLPVLSHLAQPPLLRMYAVFPKVDGKVWFHDLPKVVTDSRLRYVIPCDKEKGVVMISYTEGPDAEYWMEMPPRRMEKTVLRDVRAMFPERDIPTPLFFKTHPWTDGCTYWLPGMYDAAEESQRSLQPLPNAMPGLFMCGESFSLRQAWVEGALEQADALLKLEAFQEGL
jgi:hypothetical protein